MLAKQDRRLSRVKGKGSRMARKKALQLAERLVVLTPESEPALSTARELLRVLRESQPEPLPELEPLQGVGWDVSTELGRYLFREQARFAAMATVRQSDRTSQARFLMQELASPHSTSVVGALFVLLRRGLCAQSVDQISE